MKELAFTKESNVTAIQPEIVKLNQQAVDVNDFFEVPTTGARISLRDSKSLIEVFCEAAAENYPLQVKFKDQENPESGVKVQGPSDGEKKFSKHVLDLKPNYRTMETHPDELNRKFYLTVLYMPKSCQNFLKNLIFKP